MNSFFVAIIVAFIWWRFYYLAISFSKNRYVFAILGVVVYFFGIFIGTIILSIAAPDFAKSDKTLMWGIIPFGMLASAIAYFSLKRYWSR